MKSVPIATLCAIFAAACLAAETAPVPRKPSTQAAAGQAAGAGKTYYLALDGTADAPGSIDRPLATYRQAHAVLGAGDTLCYRGGVYTNPATFIAYATTLNAAAGERITIKPHPGEEVVFDNLGRGGGLAYLGGNGAIVEGFEFRNSDGNAAKPQEGLKTWCPGIQINGNYNTVRRNWIHDITGNGYGNLGSMRIQGGSHNEICNNAFQRLWSMEGGAAWNISHIIMFNGGNQRIHGNYFSVASAKGQCAVRQKHPANPDTLSEIYNNTFEDIPGFGVDIAGTGYRVHHNLFINSMIGAYISGGDEVPFEYNTAVSDKKTLFHVRSRCTIFKNNILYSTAKSYGADGELIIRYSHYGQDAAYKDALAKDVFRNNCYFNPNLPFKASFFGGDPKTTGAILDFSGWKALSPGRDEGSIEADPQFVDMAGRNFRTKPGSAAARMGVYGSGDYDPPLSPSAAVGRELLIQHIRQSKDEPRSAPGRTR